MPKRVAKKLYALYESSPLFKYVAAPFLLVAVPMLVTSFYANPNVGDFVKQNVPLLAGFMKDNAGLMVILVGVYSTIFLGLAKWVMHKANHNDIKFDDLLILMKGIDKVVGAKQLRFEKCSENWEDTDAAKLFCVITQPSQQIQLLGVEICNLFNALDTKKVNIQVLVAEIEANQVKNVVAFPTDQAINCELKVLNNKNSSFMTALKKKDIIVVQDVAKESVKEKSRMFELNPDNADQKGSLICYPILFKNTVVYVVSIFADQSEYFRNSNQQIYDFMLEPFGLRIKMEHSLLLLKGKVCGQYNCKDIS